MSNAPEPLNDAALRLALLQSRAYSSAEPEERSRMIMDQVRASDLLFLIDSLKAEGLPVHRIRTLMNLEAAVPTIQTWIQRKQLPHLLSLASLKRDMAPSLEFDEEMAQLVGFYLVRMTHNKSTGFLQAFSEDNDLLKRIGQLVGNKLHRTLNVRQDSEKKFGLSFSARQLGAFLDEVTSNRTAVPFDALDTPEKRKAFLTGMLSGIGTVNRTRKSPAFIASLKKRTELLEEIVPLLAEFGVYPKLHQTPSGESSLWFTGEELPALSSAELLDGKKRAELSEAGANMGESPDVLAEFNDAIRRFQEGAKVSEVVRPGGVTANNLYKWKKGDIPLRAVRYAEAMQVATARNRPIEIRYPHALNAAAGTTDKLEKEGSRQNQPIPSSGSHAQEAHEHSKLMTFRRVLEQFLRDQSNHQELIKLAARDPERNMGKVVENLGKMGRTPRITERLELSAIHSPDLKKDVRLTLQQQMEKKLDNHPLSKNQEIANAIRENRGDHVLALSYVTPSLLAALFYHHGLTPAHFEAFRNGIFEQFRRFGLYRP